MVPVVKMLQEVHDASLLQDADDADDPLLSESENEDDPLTKRPRTEPQSDKQSSSKTSGESVSVATGKVDSLVTEVTEDEVTGPAISEKIATVLNNILATCGQPLSGEKKTSIDPKTANYLLKLVSIPRFGILLENKHEAWMLGFKPCKTP